MVAREFRSGRVLRYCQADLVAMCMPPYSVADDSLLVAFYASAEAGCHLALGWPLPMRVLDLFAEFRVRTAGLTVPNGNSLLGALSCTVWMPWTSPKRSRCDSL